tara:strand:+ start:1393 stop:1608 length:216 start_codon:yes stop_codon:yes gene_type:complete
MPIHKIKQKKETSMPSPNKEEGQKDYIQRCMSDQKAIKTFSDGSQRATYCRGQWEKRDGSVSARSPRKKRR